MNYGLDYKKVTLYQHFAIGIFEIIHAMTLMVVWPPKKTDTGECWTNSSSEIESLSNPWLHFVKTNIPNWKSS